MNSGNGPLLEVPGNSRDDGDDLFSIETIERGGRAVVRLIGELDLSTRHHLDRLLNDLLRTVGATVVLDLAGLTFVDAHCLCAWRDAAEALRSRGGGLVLRNPGPLVRRLLEITDVADVATLETESRRSSNYYRCRERR